MHSSYTGIVIVHIFYPALTASIHLILVLEVAEILLLLLFCFADDFSYGGAFYPIYYSPSISKFTVFKYVFVRSISSESTLSGKSLQLLDLAPYPILAKRFSIARS